MKIYYDRDLTRQAPLEAIDFGIIEGEEGEFIERSVWLFNDTKALIRNIVVRVPENYFVEESPKSLKPHEKGEIKVSWKLKREPLIFEIIIEGEELYLAGKQTPIERPKPKFRGKTKEEKFFEENPLIHCNICNGDFFEDEYVEHLNSHRKEEVLIEYAKEKEC